VREHLAIIPVQSNPALNCANRPCCSWAAPQDPGARWARLHRLVRVPLPPLQGNRDRESVYKILLHFVLILFRFLSCFILMNCYVCISTYVIHRSSLHKCLWFFFFLLQLQESRKELAADIETLKKKIAGTE
jgi:hypothetical protein